MYKCVRVVRIVRDHPGALEIPQWTPSARVECTQPGLVCATDRAIMWMTLCGIDIYFFHLVSCYYFKNLLLKESLLKFYIRSSLYVEYQRWLLIILLYHRLFVNAFGGIELDRNGRKRKRWQWYFVKGHVHVPPFQPICFPLNKFLSIRVVDQVRLFHIVNDHLNGQISENEILIYIFYILLKYWYIYLS